jgi:hypothetical protein
MKEPDTVRALSTIIQRLDRLREELMSVQRSLEIIEEDIRQITANGKRSRPDKTKQTSRKDSFH